MKECHDTNLKTVSTEINLQKEQSKILKTIKHADTVDCKILCLKNLVHQDKDFHPSFWNKLFNRDLFKLQFLCDSAELIKTEKLFY